MVTDFTNHRFGRFVVLRDAPPRTSGGVVHRRVICKCDCGTEKETWLHSLKSGDIRSCGCFAREESGRRNRTHGKSKSATYEVWHAMLKRARGTSDRSRYYDRGIRVCDRWQSFENFLADMGERPEGLSIDRIDNDGIYEPSNCRWATNLQQSWNRQHTRYVVINGEKKAVAELAHHAGIDVRAVRGRLRIGWSIEKALSTPIAHIKRAPRSK